MEQRRPQRDGEFAVALRSALLHGAEATLFAGSGIVAQSRAPDEYAETCLKLRPMLNALGTAAEDGRHKTDALPPSVFRLLEGEDVW